MPLKMRGNAAISRECWEMCPHTSARLSAPAANRLKYSERRKGLCARSSAVSASNQPSVVMPRPPFRRPDYIERAPSQAAGSRDARGRPPVTGGVLERVREANQRRLAPRTAQQRQAEGRSVGRVARGHDDAGVACLGADRRAGPPGKNERVEALAFHQGVEPLGPREPEVLGAAHAVGRRPEPACCLGGEEEHLAKAQRLA